MTLLRACLAAVWPQRANRHFWRASYSDPSTPTPLSLHTKLQRAARPPAAAAAAAASDEEDASDMSQGSDEGSDEDDSLHAAMHG